MEPLSHPVKPCISPQHNIRKQAASPTSHGALQKGATMKKPLSPKAFQDRTSHAINALNAVITFSNKGAAAVAGEVKKFSRPPTGILKKFAPPKKQNAAPKLNHWMNVGTIDPKNRTQSNLKNRPHNEPASPLANRLKNVHTQNNENKLIKNDDASKSARNQNQFATGINKPGNYVSPRCLSKKAINVNTSANLISGNTIADYQILKQIGQGAYAIVKEATHRATNNKVAIKVYDKFKLLDPQRKKSVNREIQILQKLSHQNIVKLHETIDSIKQLYLVMEYIKGRSLYSYLKSKDNRRLHESEAKSIFKQILLGVQYCHRRNVSHRDIKLENILLTDAHEIKIIDFGFSTCYPHGTKLRVFCGTPSYMSPEIVTKKDYCGPPADMWALGILLYAMLSGKFPFKGGSDRELYKNIAKGEFAFSSSCTLSSKAKALIKQLLQMDPNKRPTCDEVLADPFMSDHPEKENTPKMILDISRYRQDIIQKIVTFCFLCYALT